MFYKHTDMFNTLWFVRFEAKILYKYCNGMSCQSNHIYKYYDVSVSKVTQNPDPLGNIFVEGWIYTYVRLNLSNKS